MAGLIDSLKSFAGVKASLYDIQSTVRTLRAERDANLARLEYLRSAPLGFQDTVDIMLADFAARREVVLRAERTRFVASDQHLRGVQIVDHRRVQRVLAGKIRHDAGRPMPDAMDVRKRSPPGRLFAQLLVLAVEQHDVADHQIARIRFDQRLQALGVGQFVGDRLFQQHFLSRLQQQSCHSHVRGRGTGNHPGLGAGLLNRLLQVGPTGHALQFRGQRIKALLPAGDQRDQLRLRQTGQRERMQTSEATKADDADLDGLGCRLSHGWDQGSRIAGCSSSILRAVTVISRMK